MKLCELSCVLSKNTASRHEALLEGCSWGSMHKTLKIVWRRLPLIHCMQTHRPESGRESFQKYALHNVAYQW